MRNPNTYDQQASWFYIFSFRLHAFGMALSTFRCKFWCFVVSGILDLDLATSALVHYELLSCADFSTVSSSSQTFEDIRCPRLVDDFQLRFRMRGHSASWPGVADAWPR